MDMTVCPKCKMRVFPKADGTCPSCGVQLKGRARMRSASKPTRAPTQKKHKVTRQTKPAEAGSSSGSQKVSASSPESHPANQVGKLHFGEVFLKSVKIIWKHKILWIPPSLLSAITLLYTNISTVRDLVPKNLEESISLASGIWTSLLCIAAIFFIVAEFVLGYGGTIIVSRGVFQVDQGRKTLSFKDLIQSARTYFWGTVGLSFLIGLVITAGMLPVILIVLFLDEPLLSNPQALLSGSWFVYLFGFFVSAIASGLTQLSLNALILEDREASNALSRGWKLFLRFLGPNLLIGLILVAITYGIVFLLTVPRNLLIPEIQSVLTSNESETVSILLYSAIGIIYWLLNSVLLGIVQTYYLSTWTLVFRRLTMILDSSNPAPVTPNA